MRWRAPLAVLLGLLLVSTLVGRATVSVLGPETFHRAAGRPDTVVRKFTVSNPSNPYTLKVANEGVTDATISLNGDVVFGPSAFQTKGLKPPSQFDKSVTLRDGLNTLAVEVRGKPGTSLSVEIFRPTPVDRTPPAISATVDPEPNEAGWNNSTVTVRFSCDDADSGIKFCPAPVTVTQDTAGRVVSGTAIDNAGNRATARVTVKLDRTAPSVLARRSSFPNPAGWYRTPVTVTFIASDLLSGIKPGSVTLPITLSQDGVGQSATGQASDRAGNVRTATRSGINIDRTKPVISVSLSPTPGEGGAVEGPVTAHFTCSDALSGIAFCPADKVITAEGSNQTVSGTAFDRAGNRAVVTSEPFSIGTVKLTISVALSPAPNAAGWNNSPVTAHFTCTASGATVTNCPADKVISTEGVAQTVSGTATDSAGHTASVTSAPFSIDLSAPSISVALSPAPNAAGWRNGPVTAHFTCSDSGSGVGVCPPDQVVTGDGADQTVTGSATDQAGNTATVTSESFSIDTTKPTIAVALSPAPNAAGWRNGPVTAHFTCSDTGAGVDVCPADRIVTVDGANQTVTGTVTDKAGNSASVTSEAFSIDQSKPTITVTLSPAPNPNGVNESPVTAHFACSDPGSGLAVGACPPDQVISTEGPNQTVTGDVTDLAGNTSTITSAPFTIALAGPTITAALSTPANANGWHNTAVTVTFTCTDPVFGISSCSSPVTVSVDGTQVVTGTATSNSGKTSTTSVTVNLDTTAPVLTVTSPAGGTKLFAGTVTTSGIVTDATSGVSGVTCNVVAGSVLGSSFSCDVPLTAGANSISAVATDLAGNSSTQSLDVTYAPKPTVALTAPTHLAYFNITPTTVTGTVDDPTATVVVNSVPAPVLNGQFSIALPIAEGPNIITATATSANGAVGTASVEVTLDTTPPRVTIGSPSNNFVTTELSISVSGIINDLVVGTVNDQEAQVTVNGAAAQVANRTYLAANVPLALGPNLIRAVGRDRVGNSFTTEITVTRQAITQQQIRLVSGSNQTGVIGSALPAPLVVALTDAAGNPVGGKPVIFKVTQNDGLLTAAAAPAVTVIATTDEDGHAQVSWRLGNRAGAGGNSVEAYSVGFAGTAMFSASGTQGAAGKIVVDTGNDQIGAIGQPLPKPFIAVVVDDGNNRLGGVPVTFSVQQGGGNFGGESSVTVVSDSDGRVAATLTLGLQEGNANNLVSASLPPSQLGVPTTFPAAFTASGRAAGDPAKTTVTGVVLDNSNQPIAGATIRAVATDALRSSLLTVQAATAVQTDEQGQFTIPQAPVGLIKLMIDGTTITRPGTYPSLEYDLVTVAGQKNDVGQPIYLLPLNTANQLCVTATTGGGTLTIPEAPGFSLTFGPGQVTFPGGSKTGCVTVTVVNGDKLPMVPGFGQQPRFIVTIQPAGAYFNTPAAITLPNVDGLKARAVTEMYSFDHDIGSFVAIGTGVVSDDGMVIRSSPGVGVIKAGWHCGGDPGTQGTAAKCPQCQTCVTNQCVADLSATTCDDGRFCTLNDICVFGKCQGTEVEDSPDGSQTVKISPEGVGISIGALELSFNVFKILGIDVKAKVDGEFEQSALISCCEKSKGPSSKLETSGTVSARVESDDIPVPGISKTCCSIPLLGDIDIVKIGVFVAGSGSLSISATKMDDACLGTKEWTGSVSDTFSGSLKGIFQPLTPDFLNASLSGTTGISGTGSITRNALTLSASWTGIEVSGEVKLLNLVSVGFNYTLVEPRQLGTVSLPLR